MTGYQKSNCSSKLVAQVNTRITVLAQNLKQFKKALMNTDLSYAILGKW